MLLLLLAYASPPPPDDTARDTADSASPGASSGDCEAHPGDAVGFETVYAGNASYVDDGDWGGEAVEHQVFATAGDWEAWIAKFTLETTPGSVDFSNHRGAAGLVVVPGTCGLSVVTTTATEASGQPIHVAIGIADSSGGCDTNCSMVGQMIVSLSLPTRSEGEPTVCVRRADEC